MLISWSLKYGMLWFCQKLKTLEYRRLFRLNILYLETKLKLHLDFEKKVFRRTIQIFFYNIYIFFFGPGIITTCQCRRYSLKLTNADNEPQVLYRTILILFWKTNVKMSMKHHKIPLILLCNWIILKYLLQ